LSANQLGNELEEGFTTRLLHYASFASIYDSSEFRIDNMTNNSTFFGKMSVRKAICVHFKRHIVDG
jgi:hypothetical protein